MAPGGGSSIDWDCWRVELAARAREAGWRVADGPGAPLRLELGTQGPLFYLSTGIHGDEPSGPLAALALVGRPDWWEGWRVVCFPELNPRGLRAGTRENPEGVDLNRDYRRPVTEEIRTHRAALAGLGRIQAAVCLHEDWEAAGVYLYYLHRDESVEAARRVLAAMRRHLPLEEAPLIDGREADHGLIHRLPEDYPGEDWPEAIYLARHHTDICYTLETPSGQILEQRVAAHVDGVRAVLELTRA
jgi:predicted deacylase